MRRSMDELVQECRRRYTALWWETPAALPVATRLYDRSEQEHRAAMASQLLEESLKELRALPADGAAAGPWRERLWSRVRQTAQEALSFPDDQLAILFSQGFTTSTRRFVHAAREFDPHLSLADLFQALRNVWIMNSVHLFLGRESGYSPSIFAYSMLYPYTDNVLDDNRLPAAAKAAMNERLGRRLAGEKADAANAHEETLFRLVAMIEAEFDRERFPMLFPSLLAIHRAQVRSLTQQRGASSPDEAEILAISVEKGGTSVLADGYLVAGELSEPEAIFAFGFGVMLQFLDDLQDVQGDAECGHMTLFSREAGRSPLDPLTARLIGFIDRVLDGPDSLSRPDLASLKAMARDSCGFLIRQAVVKHRKLFTPEFVSQLEQRSPVGFRQMEQLSRRVSGEYKALRKGAQGRSPDQLIALLLGPSI